MTGKNREFLEIETTKKLEKNFYLNCKKKFEGKKLKLSKDLLENECPFYYYLKDKNTKNPFFEGSVYLGKKVKISNNEELIIVSFQGISNALLRIKQPQKQESNFKNQQKPNIHIFLIDSMSRTHFHRMMDETGKTLQNIHLDDNIDYSFIEFFKYHSIDYSSNSNMTPFMTGEDWWSICRHKWYCNFTNNIPFGLIFILLTYFKGNSFGIFLKKQDIKQQFQWKLVG